MSKNKNSEAFDLLNSEFANVELEKENARNLEMLRKRQAIKQQAEIQEEEEYDDDDSGGGSGCIGVGFRVLLIVLLAGALAWTVFMPKGSLNELWDKVSPQVESAYWWAVELLSGEGKDSGSGKVAHTSPTDAVSPTKDESTESTVPSDPADAVSQDGGGATSSTDEGGAQITETSDSPYSITVYRPSQIVIVYDTMGNPVKVFSCSSGKAATPTKFGDYSIRAKYRWRFMVGNCYTQYASSFSSGYLLHSIPYNKRNAGTMSNASYDKLGNPASSGCVRLCFRDSKWVYDNCPIGTSVRVTDDFAPAGVYGEAVPARIDDAEHSGWDPTDDAPESPYNN